MKTLWRSQAVAASEELIHGGAATLWSPQQRNGTADRRATSGKQEQTEERGRVDGPTEVPDLALLKVHGRTED